MDFFIIFIAFDLFFFCLFDFILEMATPLKQGRPTDWAWNYFTRVPVTRHKYFHAQCNSCGEKCPADPEQMLTHLIKKVSLF